MENEQKFKAMCENIALLRKQDAEALEAMNAANARWKKINGELSEANKVLDTFMSNWKNEATKVE